MFMSNVFMTHQEKGPPKGGPEVSITVNSELSVRITQNYTLYGEYTSHKIKKSMYASRQIDNIDH